MFVKGQSGNPGGRARRSTKDGRKLPEMAREYTEEALLATVEIMRDKEAPPAARLQAISNIFDRGWGRAKQEISVGGDAENPIEIIKRVIVKSDDQDG